MLQRKISRRQFLRHTAVAGALAFPYVVPSSAMGNAGRVAPSNRIAIGCIGLGTQGTANIRQGLPSLQPQYYSWHSEI